MRRRCSSRLIRPCRMPRAPSSACERGLPLPLAAEDAEPHGRLGEVGRRLHPGHGDEPDARVLQRRDRLRDDRPHGLVDSPHAAGHLPSHPAPPAPARARGARTSRPASQRSATSISRSASPASRVTHASVRRARCQMSWWSTSAIAQPDPVLQLGLDRAHVHPLLLQRVALGEEQLERVDAHVAPCHRAIEPGFHWSRRTVRILFGRAGDVPGRRYRGSMGRFARPALLACALAARARPCDGGRRPRRADVAHGAAVRRLARGGYRHLPSLRPPGLERQHVGRSQPPRRRGPGRAPLVRREAPARGRDQPRHERRPRRRLPLRAYHSRRRPDRRAAPLRDLVDDRQASVRGRLVRRVQPGAAPDRPRAMPDLHVFDWQALARSNPQWFGPDGVHPNADGYRKRAAELARLVRSCP